MPVTISQVLAAKDAFPASLVKAAQDAQDTKAQYTAQAVKLVAGVVQNMDELQVDAEEAKTAISGFIDMKAEVNKRLDAAFAVISADFGPPAPPAPPPPPAPAPTPADPPTPA